MSHGLSNVVLWHCFSNLCIKSNKFLTICEIKDKACSVIQCKYSDIPLVRKTGPATIGWASIKYLHLCEYSLFV